MKILRIQGKVVSGSGEGKRFTELAWVKKQITEKLDFIPYPGTLNIKVTEPNFSLKNLSEKTKWMEISPANDFCRGRLVKARFMNNLECAIIIPEVKKYPKDIIELIAPINLREKLKLEDGDVVELGIMLS
ncbi:CTP-dependent riboflavin kinase [Candidatus Bathyarchaeota archaeon]|nr:CTP-dependent riboflavin kinase [Candidatus Bathyarchaeota archaeon]